MMIRSTVGAVVSMAILHCVLPMVSAQQTPPTPAVSKPARKPSGLFRLPESIALSEDQKAKLAAIQAAFEPKLAELATKADVLTEDQKQAQKAAARAAREAGKTGKDLQAAIDAAAPLTAEQKAQREEAKVQTAALQKIIRERILAILFADQRKAFEEATTKPKRAKSPSKGSPPI